MRIILRHDYEQLGKMGDIVEVKSGYARNFLIPRKIAYEATPGNLRMLEEEKRQQSRRQEKEKRSSEALAAQLEKISLTIQMKVGEDDKLFGSVTSQMITESLTDKGIELDKETTAELKALRKMKKDYERLRLEHDILKEAIEFSSEQKATSSLSSKPTKRDSP